MIKTSPYDAKNNVMVSAKEDFQNFREVTSVQGYHKRASIIHLVNVLTWTALVSAEVRSGQKVPRNAIWEQHS